MKYLQTINTSSYIHYCESAISMFYNLCDVEYFNILFTTDDKRVMVYFEHNLFNEDEEEIEISREYYLCTHEALNKSNQHEIDLIKGRLERLLAFHLSFLINTGFYNDDYDDILFDLEE